MGLNIKNAETHQLVQELAALTGESQTTAVTVAVRERLEGP
jgi:antitoxin VapB